jgi:hypothetical protein
MTEFEVPEALKEDNDSTEFVMPEALKEYHR